MAEGNLRKYLTGDTVRAKKYFYVLRPVLACRWVLNRRTPPPMRFSELARAELPAELAGQVQRLLELKMNSPEIREIPRIDALNDFLTSQIAAVREDIGSVTDERSGSWEEALHVLSEISGGTVSGTTSAPWPTRGWATGSPP